MTTARTPPETYKIRLDHYAHRVRMVTYVAAGLLGEIALIAAGVFGPSPLSIMLEALTFTQIAVTAATLVFARSKYEWETTKLRTFLYVNSMAEHAPLGKQHRQLASTPESLWVTSLLLFALGGACILVGAWWSVAQAWCS